MQTYTREFPVGTQVGTRVHLRMVELFFFLPWSDLPSQLLDHFFPLS